MLTAPLSLSEDQGNKGLTGQKELPENMERDTIRTLPCRQPSLLRKKCFVTLGVIAHSNK
jgi:hypothetical protein